MNRKPSLPCTAYLTPCSCGGKCLTWTWYNRTPVLIATHYRMISFLVAFSLMCFSIGDKIAIIVVSITWFTLRSLHLWWISVLNEGRSFQSSESHQGLCSRFKDSVKEWFREASLPNTHSADNDTDLTSSRQLPWSWQILLILFLLSFFSKTFCYCMSRYVFKRLS